MSTTLAFLFLFGTTMASNLFMEKLKTAPYELVPSSRYSGCPYKAELAPLICKLIQSNMYLYNKPQFIAPSTYNPPTVVEKCETPELEINWEPELIVEKKPLVIPQAPELPPFVMPQFPVPVIVEHPEKGSEPCESSDILEMPVVNIPAAPQLPAFEMPVIPEIVEQPESYFYEETIPEIDYNTIDEKPMVIPEAPKLPAFTMPEFPIRVEPFAPVLPVMDLEKPAEEPCLSEVPVTPEIDYHFVPSQPISIPQPPELPAFVMPELPVVSSYFEDKPIAQTPIHEHFVPLANIPAPPELPPAVLPDFPVRVEIPYEPMIKENPIKEPCLTEVIPEVDYDLVNYQRVTIPQAPELPAFVMPEIPRVNFEVPLAPVLPVMDIPSPPMIIEKPAEEQYHSEFMTAPEIDYNIIKSTPVSIPSPPESFVMPELPVRVVEEATAPELPAAPKFTEWDMPKLPATFVSKPCASSGKLEGEFVAMPNPFDTYFGDKVKETHNIMLPAAMNPNLYPSPCVYNLLMQHVIPNLASDHFRSFENMKFSPPSFLPCA